VPAHHTQTPFHWHAITCFGPSRTLLLHTTSISPQGGGPLRTVTLLTMDSSAPLAWLHSRMPVLLNDAVAIDGTDACNSAAPATALPWAPPSAPCFSSPGTSTVPATTSGSSGSGSVSGHARLAAWLDCLARPSSDAAIAAALAAGHCAGEPRLPACRAYEHEVQL